MEIHVRLGTRGDIEALVEVECSDVEVWHHFSPKGRGAAASYKELSSAERCMHGGPWMDIEALTRYWDRIERLGILPLVAEVNGKTVGHLDVIFSNEPPLGNFLYLDVLTVHKAYRRRGVAWTLIKEAERLAEARRVSWMLVQPKQYEGPSGLTYTSCGFKKAFNTYELEASTNFSEIPVEIRLTSIPQDQAVPTDTHTMICGWYNISAKMWDDGVNPNMKSMHVFSSQQLALSAFVDASPYFLSLRRSFSNLSIGGMGTFCLWTPTPLDEGKLQIVFQAAKSTASWLGIRRLTTRVLEKHLAILERVGFSVRSKGEPWLAKEPRRPS